MKGETGDGCKAAEALLSVETEEVILVLFMLGETLELSVGRVDGGEREERCVFLMLVKCVGDAVAVLLIFGDELEEEELGVSDNVLELSEGDGGEDLVELNGCDRWLWRVRVLSLMTEDEGDGFFVAPPFLSSPCLLSPAPLSTSTLTVLLSVPTLLLAVHS